MAGGYIRPIIMVDVSDVSISIDATRSKFVGGDELYLFEVSLLSSLSFSFTFSFPLPLSRSARSISIDATKSKFIGGDELHLFFS